MKEITEQWIASLAPNAAALQNGRKISRSGGFVELYVSQDESFYQGECKGSGKSNYRTSVDFIQPDSPVFRCSCPSRQFPCKHSLALLFEMLAGKQFSPCEIPEDILSKRAKKEATAEKQQEKRKNPPKVNKAARTKKLKKQLEGLELVQKVVNDLLMAGLGTLSGNSLKTYENLAKQLGDYYLPGPQIYCKRLLLEMKLLQKDNDDRHYAEATHILIQLSALVKKARAYITEKLESGSVEDDDSILFEELGGIWQTERLNQLGLCKENARLVQLSFQVYLDEARGEYVDFGHWMDIDTGDIVASFNYRPLKALKYVKEEDTVLELLSTPMLTYYPGGLNRRARWEQASFTPIQPEHYEQLQKLAYPSLAPAVKAVKNEIKNTLSDGFVALPVAFQQIGRIEDGGYVLKDLSGESIALRDRRGAEASTYRLSMLPNSEILEHHVLFGAFFYDPSDHRICLHPYSIVTDSAIVRLLY